MNKPKRSLRDLTRRRGGAEDITKIDSLGGGAAFTSWVIACCYDFMDILRASAPPREPIADFTVNAVIPAGFPNKDATFVLVLQFRSGNPCDVITELFPSFGTVRLLSATIIILS